MNKLWCDAKLEKAKKGKMGKQDMNYASKKQQFMINGILGSILFQNGVQRNK